MYLTLYFKAWRLQHISLSKEYCYLFIADLGGVDGLVWVDGTDAVADGMWLSDRGTLLTYIPFYPNEPNGHGSENCLSSSAGQVYDVSCSAQYPFVCEYDC